MFTVEVAESDTIDDVKANIVRRGMPLCEQRLIYAGILLDSGCTVSDYSIIDGSKVSLEFTELDRLLEFVRGAGSADICRMQSWSKTLAAQGDAIAVQECRPQGPTAKHDVSKGGRALEFFRLDAGEPDKTGDDLDECVLGQYDADWAELDAVSGVSCKTMVATSSIRFTTSRPPELTLDPVEGNVQTELTLPIVSCEEHQARTAPKLSITTVRRAATINHGITPGFAISITNHLIQRGAALSSLPEWDDETASVLELLRADATDFAIPAPPSDTG